MIERIRNCVSSDHCDPEFAIKQHVPGSGGSPSRSSTGHICRSPSCIRWQYSKDLSDSETDLLSADRSTAFASAVEKVRRPSLAMANHGLVVPSRRCPKRPAEDGGPTPEPLSATPPPPPGGAPHDFALLAGFKKSSGPVPNLRAGKISMWEAHDGVGSKSSGTGQGGGTADPR